MNQWTDKQTDRREIDGWTERIADERCLDEAIPIRMTDKQKTDR